MSAASAFAKENFKAALDRCAQILDGHPLLEPTGDRPNFFANWKIQHFSTIYSKLENPIFQKRIL